MTDSHTSVNTEEALEQSMTSRGESRSCRLNPDVFREFMGSGWDPGITKEVERCSTADYLPQRAVKAGEPFARECLITPVGTYKVRNNDYTYRFRICSVFVHLSDLGGGRESDSVLVLEPKGNGSHEATLYFKPRTSCSTQEFHSDSQYGESQVGVRPPLEEVHQEIGLRYAHIDTLPDALVEDAGRVKLCIVRGVNASIEAIINEVRE